jgi:pyrophosphatase PpaX
MAQFGGGRDLLDRFDAFIFDWDGTLNSMRILLRANEKLKRALHAWNRDEAIKRIESNRAQLRQKVAIEEEKNIAEAFLFDAFLLFSRPRLHNGTIEVLSLLKKNRKKVAIFSNASRYRITKELRMAGIETMFDLVASAKDTGTAKPDPTGLRGTVRMLHSNPERTLYIGDMVDDVLTADLAKVHSCAVSSGFDSHHTLASTNPDYLFRSIIELEGALSSAHAQRRHSTNTYTRSRAKPQEK